MPRTESDKTRKALKLIKKGKTFREAAKLAEVAPSTITRAIKRRKS